MSSMKLQCMITVLFAVTLALEAVPEGPPIFTGKRPFECFELVRFKPGQTLKMYCATNGNPKPNITWAKFGKTNFAESFTDRSSIELPNATPDDEGLYRCKVCNGFGCVDFHFLAVDADLDLRQNAQIGTTCELTCELEGSKFQWKKINSSQSCFASVSDKKNPETFDNNEHKTIKFENITYSDAGLYVCKNGSKSYSRMLTVVNSQLETNSYSSSRLVLKKSGESVTFECAWKNANVSWSKNGEKLENHVGSRIDLSNLSRENAGLYKCDVCYHSECRDYHFILVIDTIFKKNEKENIYIAGDDVYYNCENELSDYSINYTIGYYISNITYDLCEHAEQVEYYTLFPKITPSEQKPYFTCALNSTYGRFIKSTPQRHPKKGAPAFQGHYNLAEVFEQNEGSSAKLSCENSGDPGPNITWSKNGNNLEQNGKMHEKDTYSITLANLTKSDSGEYSCKVCNTVGCNERMYWILVGFSTSSQTVIVTEYTTVNLTCIDKYYPFIEKIEWIKYDENNVFENLSMALTYTKRNHILHFENVNLSDAANYSCTVYTLLGREYRKSFNLLVTVKRTNPDNLNDSGSLTLPICVLFFVVLLVGIAYILMKHRCDNQDAFFARNASTCPMRYLRRAGIFRNTFFRNLSTE